MTIKKTPGTSQPAATPTTPHVHRFSYDQSANESVAVSVIRAIAAVADTDPLSLQPRLYDVLDPDALEQLVTTATTNSAVAVQFRLAAYEITIRRDQTIEIVDRSAARSLNSS